MNTACPARRATSSCKPIRPASTMPTIRRANRSTEPMEALSHILGFRGTSGDDYPPAGDRRIRAELPGYYERLRRYRIAVFALMIGVLMIFTGLTSAYVFRQGWATEDPRTHEYRRDWRPLELPNTLLLINTAVLLLSSLTLEMSRRNLHARAVTAGLSGVPGVAVEPEHSLPWLGITLVLGAGFLIGQVSVWRMLERAGLYLSGN